MRISKRRREMGEEAWALYQKDRKNKKSDAYRYSNVEKVLNARRKKKELLVQYKGGKCEKCGLKSEICDVYDFHHLDPTQKEFSLGYAAGQNFSLEKSKKEADKCVLLCKNCHAITHHELANIERAKKAESFLANYTK